MANAPPRSRWITAKDAADRAPVSERTVRQRVADGVLSSRVMMRDDGRKVLHVLLEECAGLWPEHDFQGLEQWEAHEAEGGGGAPARASRVVPAKESAPGGPRGTIHPQAPPEAPAQAAPRASAALAKAEAALEAERERAQRAEHQLETQRQAHGRELAQVTQELTREFRAELKLSNSEAFGRAMDTLREHVQPQEGEGHLAPMLEAAEADKARALQGASRARWGAGLVCGVVVAIGIVVASWAQRAQRESFQARAQLLEVSRELGATEDQARTSARESQKSIEALREELGSKAAQLGATEEERKRLERELGAAYARRGLDAALRWIGLR